MQTAELDAWTGEFGDAYTVRNRPDPKQLEARIELFSEILRHMEGPPPTKILEVGANVGANLIALGRLLGHLAPSLTGIEPNAKARNVLETVQNVRTMNGQAEQLDFASDSFDLVFTSGVLIHLRPDEPGGPSPLRQACKEIARVSKQWIVAIEYFSAQPREIIYRDRKNLLWARDFGAYYMEHCGLEPVACGFAWKALTGLDNLTWWVLRKPV